MIYLVFLAFTVAVKVFKKTTPNGKVTVYLGKREFMDHVGSIDPIDGVVVVESDYLKGRKVFGQLTATYRFGREEDEVMGVKFSKEMVLNNGQLVPQTGERKHLSPIQERLIQKFGANATPFTFNFPDNAPSSVILQTGEDDQGKPLGVEYCLKAYVGEDISDRSHKRSSILLAIKKIQYAPPNKANRLPSALVSKGFALSSGKLNLEVTLDREIYYHGDDVKANIVVSNNSRKTVKNIKVMVVQHCEVAMVNTQFSRHVAELETREGCPITPGASLTKSFFLKPTAGSNKNRHGIAIDGHLKDEEVNLASSTLVADGKAPIDATGFIISYSLRVKLNCGALGGDLQTDVPFKLVNAAPGTVQKEAAVAEKKAKSLERANYEKSCYAPDEDDNIIYEDFARPQLTDQID